MNGTAHLRLDILIAHLDPGLSLPTPPSSLLLETRSWAQSRPLGALCLESNHCQPFSLALEACGIWPRTSFPASPTEQLPTRSFLNVSWGSPTLRSWLMLFPLLGVLFLPSPPGTLSLSFTTQVKCYLFGGAFLTHSDLPYTPLCSPQLWGTP